MAARPVGSQMPWYHNPEFAAARVKTIPPGGNTEYDTARPVGPVATDVTDFIYSQRAWSTTHMPHILYVLKPSQDWRSFKNSPRPRTKRDAQGRVMRERWPRAGEPVRNMLNFEILPDRIGSQEHWFVIEAWKRLDPRIRWDDIHIRMEITHRQTYDALRRYPTSRRRSFDMLNWTNINTKGNNAIIARLSQAQLDDNTTRGNTPGLTDPNDHDSERIEHPDGEDGDDEAYESDEDYSYEDEVEYEDEEEVESEDEDEDDDVTAHRDQGAGERGEPSSTATERSEEEEAAADPSNFANYTGPHRRHGSGWDFDKSPRDE